MLVKSIVWISFFFECVNFKEIFVQYKNIYKCSISLSPPIKLGLVHLFFLKPLLNKRSKPALLV